jgi:4-hydroxybenzoate polyprenyltransferase
VTDDEYKEFVARANAGEIAIGLDRATARKFYTDVPLFRIEEETGEKPFFEKAVVSFAIFAAPISLLASAVLAVLAFHWWAALVVPISIIVYFFYSGQSSMPRGKMLGISVLLSLAVGSIFTNIFPSGAISWYCVTGAFSLWCARLVYVAATTFLRAFILRNKRAYELMSEDIRIRDMGM